MSDNARMAKRKRAYSREFTPRVRTKESRRSLHVDWVPPTLYDRIVRQAKIAGVSVRTYVLRILSMAVKNDGVIRPSSEDTD